ncbi:lytic murein transglycosylase [Patescibacteria group bacterium]|nr:lytic murein transglycosylase [Patescibacteria group bacterium]
MERPRLVVDLIRNDRKRLVPGHFRVNLSPARIVRLPLITISKFLAIGMVTSYLLFGTALAPIDQTQRSFAAQSDAQRQQLEQQLQSVEAEIAKDQATLDGYKSQGQSLQSEIDRLNAEMSKLNLQLKEVQISLQQLNGQISDNQDKISTTQQQIDAGKETLGRALQDTYVNENMSTLEILLQRQSLSAFFNDLADLGNLQQGLQTSLQTMVDLHDQLLSEKETLAVQKNDAQQLQVYQAAQRQSLIQTKDQKANLLQVTKGNEAKYQALVTTQQKTAAQIRSQIFELLGGGELSFEDAYQLAKVAAQATGVRAALILAILDKESSLGQNVGKCTYDKNPYYPAQASNPTTMNPTRDIPTFLTILKQLNLDPSTALVSCPIPQDGAYGGGMGPAQFLPSTWKMYADRITSFTGDAPPSPWRNMDAFMGTALYLQDSGAANASLSQERIAAARYYAGSNWRMFLWAYGDRVVTQAQQFQSDIDILNASA